MEKKKIGIFICDRYSRCGGGKCFRAMRERVGAFNRYKDCEIELVGYTSCDGCPGGNIEYAVDEMLKNGVEIIHLATGLIVGYPPCPRIDYFQKYIEQKYNLEVVLGTHPIPQKYLDMHEKLGTWNSKRWQKIIKPVLADPIIRKDYN
jgi:predicted metal-binding protein